MIVQHFYQSIVENLTDIRSPRWIKEKLISSSITPNDNLLDYQNYILLETGYPFSVYDFDKLSNHFNGSEFSLSISNSTNNQKFLASNDLKYTIR